MGMEMRWKRFLGGREDGEVVNGLLPRCQLGRLRVVMCILCDSNPSVSWCCFFDEGELWCGEVVRTCKLGRLSQVNWHP